MGINIHGQGVTINAAVRERVERRLGFALSRFGDHVGRVTVHLIDENGPRGGVDKRCRIVVDLFNYGRAVVEDRDSGLVAAIDRAADRMGHTVRRRLARARLYAGLASPERN